MSPELEGPTFPDGESWHSGASVPVRLQDVGPSGASHLGRSDALGCEGPGEQAETQDLPQTGLCIRGFVTRRLSQQAAGQVLHQDTVNPEKRAPNPGEGPQPGEQPAYGGLWGRPGGHGSSSFQHSLRYVGG